MSAPGEAPPTTATVENDPRLELETGNIKLRQKVDNLENQPECWIETNTEVEATTQTLRDRVAALETDTAAISGQFRLMLKDLEAQFESLTRAQTVQGEQLALWEERSPLLTAICTQIYCSEKVLVILALPEHLNRRSNEAMEIGRKHSLYLGEKTEQTAALVAMQFSNDPSAAKHVNSWR